MRERAAQSYKIIISNGILLRIFRIGFCVRRKAVALASSGSRRDYRALREIIAIAEEHGWYFGISRESRAR